MNHFYLSANQNHRTSILGVWKFIWAISLIFSVFLAQAQPCSTSIDFSSAIATGPTQAPNTWYTDRYAPSGFAAQSFFNGDNRLKHSIATADGAATRPIGQQTTFYNTQGRQLDLISGVKFLEIKLYIPSAWASSNKRMAGLWGSATDASNAISAYPIIEFTSDGNNPRFRGYESGGAGSWADLGLPSGFAYDQWVTLKIQLLSSGEFQYTVGNLTYTTTTNAADASKQIANAILQGYNYDPNQPLDGTNTGVAYDIYWDDFSAKVSENVITNTNTGKTFCSIQSAIDDVTTLDGHTLVVSAGTYTENVLINKALTINGPNIGIPGTGSRSAEAILSNGTINVTSAGNVVIDGFHIYHTNNSNGMTLAGGSPVTVQNSKFERVGVTPNQFALAIETSDGSGVKTIKDNLFTGSDAGGLFSSHVTWQSGIYINGAASTVNVTGNTFEKLRAGMNIDDLSAGINITGNTFKPNGTHLSFGGSNPTSGSHVLGANEFKTPLSGIVNLSNVDNTFKLDITSSTFNGAAFSTYPLATLFLIESAMTHRGRVSSGIPRNGLVTYVAGNQYVVAGLTTIQSAVNYGTPNDIINVKNGTYDEEVTISKALNLKGANAGTPGNGTRVTESILTGNNGAHSGFVITSSNVTIDGFTVTGAAGTYGGIYSSPTTSGVTVKNNIITDNVIGVYPSSNGASFVNNNLFNANNRAGSAGGAGIYVEETNTLTVELNEFKGHTLNSAAIFASSVSNKHQNLTFSRNYIHDNNDGNSMVYLNGVTNGTISYNNIAQSGTTAVKLAGANSNVTVVHNELNNNATAVKIQNDGPGPNTGIQVHENSIVSTTAINNLDVATVDASCNWYGSSVAGDVTAKVFGPVNYLPFTNTGTDNNGAAIGFEPVPNSCIYPVHNLTHPKDFATIQSAINDPITEPNDVIQADNGTYNEDVTINKAITLQGESRNGTIIKGLRRDNVVTTGGTRTVNVTASNVTIKNLTVTRDYNGNEAGWKTSTKTEGIIIENQDNLTLDNVLVKDNRTGVYLHNTKNTIVRNSEIVANRTGFQVWGPLDNTQIINNFITGNFTHGIVFNFDQGPTSAPGMKISNNNISGNWYTQISFQRGSGTPASNVGDLSTLDLTCNWYGAAPTATVGPVDLSMAGYTTQTTSQFGGMAPATTLYIAGEEAAGKNFVPYLNNGTDDQTGTPGFQPVPGSCVAPVRNLTHPKSFATIQAAINDPITVANDVIQADNGTYNEDVVITKSITLQGESRDGTILKGLLKDGTAPTASASPYSLVINADDVTVKNITVTRDYGNTQTGWFNSLKSYGLIIENKDRLTVDNVLVKDNRNGVFLHNTKNTVVKNSSIIANRTGFQVFGPLDNTQIINNFITGNFTHGFLFNFDQGLTSAPGMKIYNNNISGNWYTQISFQRGSGTPASNVGDLSTLDLTCNWYGAVPTATVGPVDLSMAGYSTQNTSQFGGMAPATTLYIAGEEAAGKNFIPYLNNGTDSDGAAGFQPVPNSCVSPIQNLTHQKYFGTIQAAINDPITEPGDVIKIDAGTYTENFTVTKNLTFEGANKDVCGTNSRGAETILIAPATPTGVISLAASVSATFNGFLIDGMGVAYLNDPSQSLTVKNSVFELDFVPSQNNLYSNASAVTLDCNYFKAMGGTNDGGSSSHIFIGNGALTATNNKFTSETAVSALTGATTSLPVWINLTANTSSFSVQSNVFTKIDIGILLASNAGGGTIQNNEFSEAKRNNAANGYGAGIAIFDNYTPATAVTIQNNKFYNSETGIRTSVDGSGPYSFPASSLLTISNNSFETIPNGSFRIGSQFNSSVNSLSATCNWFNNAPVITGNPANITYLPKLVSGTDESPAIGFQTSAACLLPVRNITRNTYFATIQGAINDAGTMNGDEIVASDGTYNERVTVSKQVTLTGASKAGTILDGTGLSGTGSGIFINNGITNVTIRNFTIQNFTGSNGNTHAGIYANAGNNNLTITDVIVKNNSNASGIYANGPISDVLIDKVDALNNGLYNGPAARGIVIWNGLKKNITITNSNVQSNTCCGIELQDGSATGVLIKGNTIVGNDNAIGLVGLTSGSGLGKANIIENNTITVNGRFGIEVKNPNGTGRDIDTEDGAIIVRSNTITFGSTPDQRDLAGIAIIRRGVLAGNVDVPTGVVVKNNTVSGFKQPSSSDGFGIVVEGTNHTVTGNTLNNNDVGIQQQAGYGGYPGDGDQSNLADTYFGRGNSPLTCGNIVAPNTFNGNAANAREVGASTGGGTVTNTNTGKTFCSIQSAINDATTLNGHTITVGAGTYNEEVTVSKSLTLTGANVGIAGNGSRAAETIVDGNIGTHGGFVVTANNVTIDGFRVNGAAGTYGAGVYSSPTTSGLVLQNNVISDNAIGAYPSSNGASWVKRNLFVANNRPGSAGGAGIYVEATNALTIDGNEFRGHTNNSAVILASLAPNAHQNLVFTNNNVHDNNNGNSMVYLSGVNSATISSNTVVQSGATAIKVAGGNANITLTNNVLNGNTTAIKVQNDGVGPNTGVQATNNSLVSTRSVDNQDVNDVTLTCNYYGVTSYVGVLAKLAAGSTGKNLLNSIATTNTYSSCVSPTGLALVASTTTCVGSPSSVTATGLLASTSTIATYAVNDGTPQTYTATTTAAGELIISAVIPAGTYAFRVTSLEANGTIATINPPLSVTGTVQASVVAGTVSGSSTIGISATTTYTNTGGTPGGTWSSSNPAVATVDNAGLVTGVASGTANIIYTVTGCGGTVSSQATVTVQNSDLAPGVYALPGAIYGVGNFTLVVDVFQLSQVPSTGTTTVFISKDARFNLTFPPSAMLIGGRPVQNGSWSFNSTNDNFYILTTTQPIAADDVLSLGLNGTLNPNNTQGSLTISVTISGTNEVQLGNNSNAARIDYFKQ